MPLPPILADPPLPIVAIMGPTAGGKSDLAVALAERVGGEIVSMDSMQVYRGMDIGTAKPSAADRARVPHHLLDIMGIEEPMDVFAHTARADAAAAGILSRGRTPILVGGTGLYMHAFIHGAHDLPSDKALRDSLWREFGAPGGLPLLVRAMEREDPESLARIGPNLRRLVRALEVVRLTGRPIVRHWSEGSRPPRPPVRAWKLEWSRPDLRRRIAARVDAMLAAGFLEEARRLIAAGLLSTPTARQAIGYRRAAAVLEGALPAAALRDAMAADTAAYARRQDTWFRNRHPEAVPLPMPMPAEEAVRRISEALGPSAGAG